MEGYLTSKGFAQQLFLIAPNPTKEEIGSEMRIDIARNPNGDYYKPPRRSENEIIAEYKIRWVKTMVGAFEKEFF